MRKFLLASAALGMLVTSVEAAPIVGGRTAGIDAPSAVQNVWWRRVCNPYGRHCRLVWVHRERHWRR